MFYKKQNINMNLTKTTTIVQVNMLKNPPGFSSNPKTPNTDPGGKNKTELIKELYKF